MVYDQDAEGNEIIRPSERASQARDRWLADNPHYKDRMRGQLTGHGPWSEQELDNAVERWQQLVKGIPLERWREYSLSRRDARLRRARRRLRLAITLSALAIGTALALVVFYGILGYH